MKQFYYIDKNGQRIGPIDADKMKNEKLTPSTLVWSEDMSDWQQAGNCPELYGHLTTHTTSKTLRIILIAYAIIGSLVALILSRFIAAIIASCFNEKPQTIGIPLLILFGTAIVCSLFIKKRKYCLHTLLIALPFLTGSLFTLIYYSGINNTQSYRQGYCIIEKKSGYGVLNTWGMEHIPCIYQYMSPLDKTGNITTWGIPYYYKVEYEGLYGIINKQGEEVIPCEYTLIINKSSSTCVVKKDNQEGLYNLDGEEIIPCEYSSIQNWHNNPSIFVVEKETQKGLYNLNGEKLLECEYSFFCTPSETTGFSKINIGGVKDEDSQIEGGIWGMVNQSGILIIPCKYNNISTYSSYIRAERDYATDYYDPSSGNYLRTELNYFGY